MQHTYYSSKHQPHSHTIITLNRQIQALSPIRISYQNLQKYHSKISFDLQSLIQQHDFAINSLRSNHQNLVIIANRTEQQRNFVLEKLRDLENQNAKIIFDTKNLAQKIQSLNHKLKLQVSQNQSNQSFSSELNNIFNSLKTHIEALQNLNSDLTAQQNQINDQLLRLNKQCEIFKQKNSILQTKSNDLKNKIVSINLKNDDLIDLNNKLSQQINMKDEEVNLKNKNNRQLKQKLIGLSSDYQKLKNQIQYKKTLLGSQKVLQVQLQTNKKSIQSVIQNLTQEKKQNEKDNQSLDNQIYQLEKTKDESVIFKLNSENHLTELKKANQILLQKMEQYCIQDREMEALLLKKISSLDLFSKRLNRQYEFDREKTNVFKQKLMILNQRSLNLHKPSFIKEQRLQNTRSSSKSPWLKENFA